MPNFAWAFCAEWLGPHALPFLYFSSKAVARLTVDRVQWRIHMKYHLITYGCQMNTADSEEMAQPLKDRGFLATSRLHDADIVLMNTCTVRDQAEHRADSNIGRLRVWKDQDPNRILIVAGCAASRWGDSIKKKYSFIDLVSPATKIEEFPQAVAQVLKERWNWDVETKTAFSSNGVSRNDVPLNGVLLNDVSAQTPYLFGDDHTAYITTMRGCNYSCSYCIVPQVRGRENYRALPEILAEIITKVAEGYREVMLLGQTVNSYYYRNSDSMIDFADLLRAVNAIDGVEKIRFMSPHPRHMKDRVIQAMAECPKVARHIHLPAQSGSDRLLDSMKRLYTRAEYQAIVDKLRAAIPGLLITTDIIVGYPGEADEDFEATLSLLRTVRFDGLFAFKYSPRPGTASADKFDDVPDATKEERLQQVLALNTEIKKSAVGVTV
jgi:tRNA-2-methylthio-N6-dimethylallyladenosine synthase